MIIDILFFHCSFVDMLNIISMCRDILCVDINVDKRCVDHSTSEDHMFVLNPKLLVWVLIWQVLYSQNLEMVGLLKLINILV